MYRLTAALLIGGGTLGLTLLSPAAGILALMAYLPLMAELRRVLLYVEPWTGQDALVLVPAAAAGFLYVLSLPKARRIPPTRLNTLMVSLLVVMILQIGNPLQGPLAVGIAGALFYIVPLLWFWIGRSLVSPALLWRVLAGVVVPISIAAGVYGVYQNVAGLPWHQAQWIESGGYTALHGLSGSIKSFGPFPSSQEYATYLLIGTIVLASAALAGRKPLLALPALIPLIGMLMTGSRGPIVALVAGLATLLAVRGRRPRAWLPRLVMAGVLMVAGLYFTLTHIDPSMVSDTYRPHLQHQIDGLTKPGRVDRDRPRRDEGAGRLGGTEEPRRLRPGLHHDRRRQVRRRELRHRGRFVQPLRLPRPRRRRAVFGGHVANPPPGGAFFGIGPARRCRWPPWASSPSRCCSGSTAASTPSPRSSGSVSAARTASSPPAGRPIGRDRRDARPCPGASRHSTRRRSILRGA